MLTILPDKVTPEIVRACGALGVAAKPTFVPIRPAPGALPNKCILNAQRLADSGEGEVVCGWKVYLWASVLVEFIGHAVLCRHSELVCVTPERHGDERVLFVRDYRIQFDFSDPLARMPTKRVASSRHQDVAQLIRVEERIAALKSNYPPTSGEIRLEPKDGSILERLERAKRRWMRDVALRTWKPAASCCCGSGRAFRSCCRPHMAQEQRAQRAF